MDGLIEAANTFGDLAAYGDHLRRMHLFHRRVDGPLAAADRESFARWGIGSRAAWLAEDLAALSIAPLPLSSAGAPPAPSLANAGKRLGAFYVLIGSALGAAFLVKRLGDLGIEPRRGGRYLSSMATSRAWTEFLPALESAPLESNADLIAGANGTFDFLIDHLEESHGA